jgi:glycosyltransferase involved in cell wall biosynthesis
MKPKVLMIETSGFGGLAYYTYCLCKRLAESPHFRVSVLTDINYELANHEHNYNIIQKKFKGTPYLTAVYHLLDVIKKESPNIVHVQSLLTARKDWILFLLSRLFRIPVVYTSHNVLPHDEEEKTAFGMRFAFGIIHRWSNAIITHSESNLYDLIKLYRLKGKKIKIIKHGNYLFQSEGIKRYSKADARGEIGLEPDDEVVLFSGAVREYKGIMDLLKAIKRLSPRYPKLRLLIAGKAKEQLSQRIESFIDENQLRKVIQFENRYIDLNEFSLFFDASDVAALPYKHSYGSGALQTAMAFSKPIILTDLPFFREILIESENAFFFKNGDIESLSEKIADFFSLSKAKQDVMAETILSIAKDKYGWRPIAEKTLKLYKQIIH